LAGSPRTERRRRAEDKPSPPGAADLQEIYGRPGFKIRRAHQIAQSIFMEECRAFDLTPTQYGLLFILAKSPGLDQISLARLLGLDRSTAGMVIAALVRRKLIRRSVARHDRRKRTLHPTPAALRLLAEAAPVVSRAQERVLAPFAPAERCLLLSLLDRLLAANNASVRVPLLAVDTATG
jgi:DNA-binding MarR family transcriptional regulator